MVLKTRSDLISAYIKFFKKKGHKEIPSSSIIPADDPTVLFTTAGMHPLVPFILGQEHPLGKKLVSVQKCIRTGDIEEIGDEVHHTFFEMLGNWSFGDYWKKEAIKYTFEFHTKILKMPSKKYAVTCFKGDNKIPKDKESEKIWLNLGMPKERIAFLGKESNFWGPAGESGPCGPCTEMFYWKSSRPAPKTFDPKDENWVEIGNDVFMEYNKTKNSEFLPLTQKNVDFGGGVERTLAILNNLEDDYQTSPFQPIIKEIEKISNKKYDKNKKEMRIIADHIKSAVFIIAEGIAPSNIGRGYVLRRLIRKAIRHGYILEIKENFTTKLVDSIISIYPDYKELKQNRNQILTQLDKEENRFRENLESGMREFKKLAKGKKELSGKDAFLLFQSYGFPIEMTQELAKENKIKVNIEEYKKEFEKHQELSRTASTGTFKSGLADSSEKTKKLHTATHMLDEALRRVLDDKNIKQKGSNITHERLRYDFNFPRKLTDEEIKQLEKLVNQKINDSLNVKREEMPLKEAIKSGASYLQGAKYPKVVSVYTIEDKKDKKGFYSKEICTGPHVNNTSELKNFKITKEESVAAGIRRIKAVLE